MRPEIRSVLGDEDALRKAEDLEAPTIGEDRPRPADEAVEPASTGNELVTRTQQQMVGVGQDDFRARLLQVALANGLDGTLGADRYEGRRLDGAMGGLEFASARRAIGGSDREAGRWHAKILVVRAVIPGVDQGVQKVQQVHEVLFIQYADSL